MQVANIYQAKTQLSKLVDLALAGQQVVIARANRPVVELVPYKKKAKKRVPGLWKGKVWIADDFNDESEEINNLFYGEE